MKEQVEKILKSKWFPSRCGRNSYIEGESGQALYIEEVIHVLVNYFDQLEEKVNELAGKNADAVTCRLCTSSNAEKVVLLEKQVAEQAEQIKIASEHLDIASEISRPEGWGPLLKLAGKAALIHQQVSELEEKNKQACNRIVERRDITDDAAIELLGILETQTGG